MSILHTIASIVETPLNMYHYFKNPNFSAIPIQDFSSAGADYVASMESSEFKVIKSFESYEANRINNFNSFAKLKAADDKPVGSKLSEAANGAEDSKKSAQAIETHFKVALSLSVQTKAAKNQFNETIAFLSDQSKTFPPAVISNELMKARNTLLSSIKQQQETEIKKLDELSSKPPFVADVKKALGFDNDDQVKNFMQESIETLKKSHENQIKAVENTFNSSVTKLSQDAQKERDRITLFAMLDKNNKNMKKIFDELALKIAENNGTCSISIGKGSITDSSERFKGISLKDISERLETATGKKIHYDNASGSISMQMPNRYFSPLYYRGGRNRLQADLMTMAQFVKAEGNNAIIMSLTHSDKEHGMLLAREAYTACRNAGFDTSNISINLNGEKIDVNKLFEQAPSSRQAAEASATQFKKSADNAYNETKMTPTEIKHGLKEIRKKHTPPAAPQSSAPISPQNAGPQ